MDSLLPPSNKLLKRNEFKQNNLITLCDVHVRNFHTVKPRLWHTAKGEYDVIEIKIKPFTTPQLSSNNACSLSPFNTTSNIVGNGRTGYNILLRSLLEASFETFFAKMNVRQHTNKSVDIHVKFHFTAAPCKQKFCNVRRCLNLCSPATYQIP
jgi:hypothetical protein